MPRPLIWFEREPPADYRAHVVEHTRMLGPAQIGSADPYTGVEEARGIVAGALRYDAAVMDRAPGLVVIGRTGIGVDSVDLVEATERGIAVCNAPEAPTISTAEHAVMLTLACAKQLVLGQARLRQGAPDLYASHDGVELAGKRMGLVGFGRISRRVAKVALALDMEVSTYDPFVTHFPEPIAPAPSLEALVRSADVISVHTPLTEQTRRMFDKTLFETCRRGVIFVNTARGGLVDHDALLEALDAGIVGAAGLDVTEPEPLSPDHPLLHRDDVIVTPHVATANPDGRRKNFAGGYLQVLDVLGGTRPEHLVNPEAWAAVIDRLQEGA